MIERVNEISTNDWEHCWIAHGILVRNDRVLFIRRADGRYLGRWWDVPGGQVETGETPAVAAVREMYEESGIEGAIDYELTHFRNVDTKGRSIIFHTVTFKFTELGPERSVRIEPQEHSEFRWLTFPEAIELKLVWHVRATVEQKFGPLGEFR